MPAVGQNPSTHPRPYLSRLPQFVWLASFYFAVSFFWATILQIVVPMRAEQLATPATVGTVQGTLLAVGAFFSMLLQVSIGFVSDSTQSRWGRRKPFLVIGILLALPSVFLFLYAGVFWLALLAYVLIQIFLNSATVPYQAMLPDLVPMERHGTASGLMSLANLLGAIFGLAVFALIWSAGMGALTLPGSGFVSGHELTLLGIAYTLLFLGLMLAVLIKIPSWPRAIGVKLLSWAMPQSADGKSRSLLAHYFHFELGKNPQFVKLLISRTSIFFAFYIFAPMVYRFTRANLGIDPPQVATSLLLIVLLIGGLIGTLLGGTLADRFGKKPVIFAGIGIITILMFPLLLGNDLRTVALPGFFIGMGWGAFIAADWAFACTLIPKEKTARYMGVWDLSTLLPQVIGAFLAGVARDVLVRALPGVGAAPEAQALRIIFSSTVVFFILGLYILTLVKEPRPSRPV